MNHPVLVHYHIFKNAGTSLDLILQRCFGERWTAYEGEAAAASSKIVRAEQLRAYLQSRPELLAVSSHRALPPLPHPGACPIVLLRHPLERARSVFTFVAAQPDQPCHALARERGFAGYVEWALESRDGGIAIRNFQVVHLSAASVRTPLLRAEATDADLTEAKALLDGWGVFGIVRRFEDSCRLFQRRYGPIFPALEMKPVRANATRPEDPGEARALAEIREELGAACYRRLEQANALDLALYEFALARFEQALAAAA